MNDVVIICKLLLVLLLCSISSNGQVTDSFNNRAIGIDSLPKSMIKKK